MVMIWTFLSLLVLVGCSGSSAEQASTSRQFDGGLELEGALDAGDDDEDLVEPAAEQDAGDELPGVIVSVRPREDLDDGDDEDTDSGLDIAIANVDDDAGDDEDLVEPAAEQDAGGDDEAPLEGDDEDLVDPVDAGVEPTGDDEDLVEPPAALPWGCAESCRTDVEWCQATEQREQACAEVAACSMPECTRFSYIHPTYGELEGYNCGCGADGLIFFGNGAARAARDGIGLELEEYPEWLPHLETLWACCG